LGRSQYKSVLEQFCPGSKVVLYTVYYSLLLGKCSFQRAVRGSLVGMIRRSYSCKGRTRLHIYQWML